MPEVVSSAWMPFTPEQLTAIRDRFHHADVCPIQGVFLGGGRQTMSVSVDVEPLAEAAPVAVSAALEAIDAASTLPPEAGMSVERACYERTLGTEDRLEALAAFKEKRPPRYTGR